MATEHDNDNNTVLLPNLFEDTLNLLMEAHEYFTEFGNEDQARAGEEFRTLYSCEMSRITMRLSAIMAWLMIRKAVFMGKLTAQEADNGYGLDAKDVCLLENDRARAQLPSYMNYLLDESLLLYERVTRLDDMVAQKARA